MIYRNRVNVGTTINTLPYVLAAPVVIIPAGTVMLFYQAAAPTGWTIVTTQNNKALRVVSSSGGVAGGTTAFSTVFANQTPTISGAIASTILATTQIPAHNHLLTATLRPNFACSGDGASVNSTGGTAGGTALAGGGLGHTHANGTLAASAITMNVQYIDIIMCSKD